MPKCRYFEHTALLNAKNQNNVFYITYQSNETYFYFIFLLVLSRRELQAVSHVEPLSMYWLALRLLPSG